MSLSEILNNTFKGDYSTLFTHRGGYLQKDNNKWSLTKKAPRETEKLEYLTELAKKIVQEGIGDVVNPQAFVIRFNEEWTPRILKAKGISLHEGSPENSDKAVQFSSKIEKYSFLSNFFPTLIVMSPPTETPGSLHVYFSSEHAYLSWKVADIDQSTADGIAKGSDPLKAKKEITRIEKSSSTERKDKERVRKMLEIVRNKFEQNPTLKIKLEQTKRRKLIEATKDEFWGIGNQTGKKGKNYLGKAIMKVRSVLFP